MFAIQKIKRTIMKKIIYAITTVAFLTSSMYAQDVKMPAPSPAVVMKQDFSTSFIEISYSRPSSKGRKVFGDLVQYGQPWRTGANAATQITIGEDVNIKGNVLKAGAYSFYTIPGEKEWTIVFNSALGGWGNVTAKTDLFKITVPAIKSVEAVNTLLIYVDNITNTTADIIIAWENTKVAIPVLADNDAKITKYLEDAINNPKIPYQQAANYYLETGKNLDKAAHYADKALELNPNAFWLYALKAKVLAKQGKKKEAIEAATIAAEKSKATPYANDYQKVLNDIKNAK